MNRRMRRARAKMDKVNKAFGSKSGNHCAVMAMSVPEQAYDDLRGGVDGVMEHIIMGYIKSTGDNRPMKHGLVRESKDGDVAIACHKAGEADPSIVLLINRGMDNEVLSPLFQETLAMANKCPGSVMTVFGEGDDE